MKNYEEYFHAVVESKSMEPKETITVKRYGFLWLRKSENTTTESEYFLLCKMDGTRFPLKIKVGKNVYDQAEKGSSLSIRLSFKYCYSSFHFLADLLKPQVFEASERGL